MRRLRSIRPARLVAVLVFIGALLGLQLASSAPASALGAGRVCVFYFPYGGAEVGHVGWAFSVPGSNTWIYGSADGSNGSSATHGVDAAPITGGVWVMAADNGFQDVLSTFRARAYWAYTCKNTAFSAVGGAQNKAFSDRSFNPVTNNCANHVDDILSTYSGGVFTTHYATTIATLLPLYWYETLAGSDGQGFDADQPLYAPPGFRGGTVMTSDLAMRNAGYAGPVSLSSSIHRRTSLGTRLVIVCWMNGPRITATWANGVTYSTSVWDAVNDANATSLSDANRYAVSDAWMDTGGDTSRLVGHC